MERGAGDERGQMLAIVALVLIVVVAMVGLIVDVGYAWGQQRDTQNGTDAAAHAGAIELVTHMAEGTTPNDFVVWQKVTQAGVQNGIDVTEAEYTDWQANPLGAMVGPSDGTSVPTGAAGVRVVGEKRIGLFLAPVIGISDFDIHTTATAVGGNITSSCDVVEGCALLPIAIPATMVTCSSDGQDSVPATDPDGNPLPWPEGEEIIVPMCGDNPGSVGWIDWTPTTDGGASETADYVLNPPALDIDLPSWHYITATGGVAAAMVALNTYAGQVVLVPLFDSTCGSQPTDQFISGCPPADVGAAGPDQWYHLPSFAAFRLDYPTGAYTNDGVCDTGNGATACVIGTFVKYVGQGTVGPANPNSDNFGVQLVD